MHNRSDQLDVPHTCSYHSVGFPPLQLRNLQNSTTLQHYIKLNSILTTQYVVGSKNKIRERETMHAPTVTLLNLSLKQIGSDRRSTS